MIHTLSVYVPTDRRHALAQGVELPERTKGAALFADISGFTPLTEALTRAFGPRGGVEELTRQLNHVYDALIAEVSRYGGSVISFAGDAVTCWFADPDSSGFGAPEGSLLASLRGTACALAMQRTMQQFATVPLPDESAVTLAMKAAVTSGPARRFVVGDPAIQLIDTLVGETVARMAEAEHLADRGEVVLDVHTVEHLNAKKSNRLNVAEWRTDPETGERFAVVDGLVTPVEPTPWLSLPAEALGEALVQSWLLPPVYGRLRAGLGEFVTELRPAVALFLRFQGIDYDYDRAAGTKLDAYVRWVQGVLARYEGSLLQISIGDKGSYLYAAFGAPMAHEDNARRAATAALELRDFPPELDFIRSVQIGISQGKMRTGAYGGKSRRTYGVLGDEVNLAARLMQHATRGEVLVSGHVQKTLADSFECELLPPIQVKGKAKPVPVARLVDERRSPTRAALYEGALVGRQEELAHMMRVLERVRAGDGQVLQLEGETGIGKSRLAAEFAVKAVGHGVKVCIGTCQSTTRHIAYSPWRMILNDLMKTADETSPSEGTADAYAWQIAQLEARMSQLNPDWAIRLPLLGDLLGLPIPDNATTTAFDPRLRQEALFALVVELVQTLAHDQPLLLIVEDAHWMDEASQGLTLALGRTIAQSPVLLVLIQRPPRHKAQPLLPDLDSLSYYGQIDLKELSSAGIAALVASRLTASEEAEREVSALVLSLIQARAQGNPFFAEELVDALRETEGLLYKDGQWQLSDALINDLHRANCLVKGSASGEWSLCDDAQLSAIAISIPDSVHGAVLSRLDRLPELHKLTLKVASVIGRVFELETLARAHPSRPDHQELELQHQAFQERDFVLPVSSEPPVTYMFKHNLTQEVVYETLLGTQQRGLHRAVGTVLETISPEAVEQSAYHFGRSGVRYKTLFYLDKAAHKAQRNYANETALNYYEQALAMEELWEWRKGQIEVLHTLGRREEEETALRALEAIPDAPAFEVAYLWGQYHEAMSDYAQAQAAVERALAASREWADRINEVNCLAQLGLIARRQGDYERAKDWYQRALALFQEKTTYSLEEATAFVQAFNGLGIVHRQQGNFDEAKACYEQALVLSQQSGNQKGEAEVLNSLGSVAFYQRSFTKALTHYQQALEMRRAIGDRAGEGTSLLNLAQVTGEMNNYSQAEDYYLTALTIQQAMGNRWEEGNTWNSLGVLYHEVGNLPKARDCLERGLELSPEIGDEAGQAYLLANLGLVIQDQGDLTTACGLLESGLALAQKQDDKYLVSYFQSHLGIVNRLTGKLDQARDYANQALSLRSRIDLQLWTTADLTTLAAIEQSTGDIESACDYARQALAILEECKGHGIECPQRDYFICYQVLAAAGETETAYQALQAAYNLIITKADKITDLVICQAFLEKIPINQQIVEEAKRVLGV
jgi:predicted ATPase/class 3 adenylate cyclase